MVEGRTSNIERRTMNGEWTTPSRFLLRQGYGGHVASHPFFSMAGVGVGEESILVGEVAHD